MKKRLLGLLSALALVLVSFTSCGLNLEKDLPGTTWVAEIDVTDMLDERSLASLAQIGADKALEVYEIEFGTGNKGSISLYESFKFKADCTIPADVREQMLKEAKEHATKLDFTYSADKKAKKVTITPTDYDDEEPLVLTLDDDTLTGKFEGETLVFVQQ